MICDSLAFPFAVVGLLSGLHIATIEAYSGYKSKRFFTSIIIGLLVSLYLSIYIYDINPGILFAMVVGVERMIAAMFKNPKRIYAVLILAAFTVVATVIPIEPTILNGLIWGVFAGIIGTYIFNTTYRLVPIGGIIGVIFSFFTFDYGFLLMAVIGAERMVVGLLQMKKNKKKEFLLPYIFTWLIYLFLFTRCT